MKKIIIGFLLVLIGSTPACTLLIQPKLIQSNLKREVAPPVNDQQISSLVEDNTAFALHFYDQIDKGGENIVYSPISLSTILAMTLAGAETPTSEAILDTLEFSLPEDQIHTTFNALLVSILPSSTQKHVQKYFSLNMANSLWGQSGLEYKKPFLDILAREYGSGIYLVDFQKDPQKAQNAINNWVTNETDDQLKDAIPRGAVNELTRFVLVNAIVFDGQWMYEFSNTGTAKAPFYLVNGSEISVDMMRFSDSHKPLEYTQKQNVQIVRLPYRNDHYSMTIMVPDSGEFQAFEFDLSPENLSNFLDNLERTDVRLKMPKFSFENAIDATEILSNMGMSGAFDPFEANFSGITDSEDLYISKILQKARITVDEAGTEAAAASIAFGGIMSAPPGEPVELVIDRPFIYLIQHNPTGTILFMGRVLHP